MLTVQNNGQELVATNYWESEQAASGSMILSWNAGAARLLVPSKHENTLPEMLAAKYAIITFGKWREQFDRDAFEILFEDHSNEPYAVFLSAEQSDRRLPKSEAGVQVPFTIWTSAGCRGRMNAHYRLGRIPCLKPISGPLI